MNTSKTDWSPLGAVSATGIGEARQLAHWALNVAAAAGGLLPAKDDASHTNLGWSGEYQALLSHALGGGGIRAGLCVPDFEWIVVNAEGVLARQSPVGQTVAQGLAWFQETLETYLGSSEALALLEHDMPEHALATGAPFAAAESQAMAELGRWFNNADLAIRAVAAAHPNSASEVRCWPHHFDIASLITVEAHADPEEARTIGVGLSPGDGGYPQPYWYVTPWPKPAVDALGALPVGDWHTEGWVGAVLTGSELLGSTDAQTTVAQFHEAAITECQRLVTLT